MLSGLISSMEKIHILSFPTSRNLQHSLAHGVISPICVSAFLSCSLSLTLLLPSYKDPCDNIRPTQLIQDNLLILNILNLTMSAKSFLPCKVTYSQVPGIRVWTSWGPGQGYYSAYHTESSVIFLTYFTFLSIAHAYQSTG